MNESSRINGLVNRVLDTAMEELEQAGVEGTRAVIHSLKEWLWKWIPNQLSKIKSKQTSGSTQEMTLDDLNKMITKTEELIELGRRDEEIRVTGAMIRLNYSKEQIQQILDLAKGTNIRKD